MLKKPKGLKKTNKKKMKYQVNKEKCVGCGLCLTECPGGNELGEDGKAQVVSSEKLGECQAEKICPYGAIEKIEE